MTKDTSEDVKPSIGKTWADLLASFPIWLIGLGFASLIGLMLHASFFSKRQISYGILGTWGPQSELSVAAQFPTGAIMAFDGVQGCPDGWETYTPATGRTIIGSGTDFHPKHSEWFRVLPNGSEIRGTLTGYEALVSGGQPEVTLDIEHIPSHRHMIEGVGNRNGQGTNIRADSLSLVDGGYSRGVIATIDNGFTENAGSSRVEGPLPFSNMPPFIALPVCIHLG